MAIHSIDTCLFPELLTKPERRRTCVFGHDPPHAQPHSLPRPPSPVPRPPSLLSRLVSIDPDSNGAVTTFTWPASAVSSPSSPRHQTLVEMLRSAEIVVHDMPTETWEMRSRVKKRPSALAMQRLLRPLLEDAAVVRVAVEFSTPTHLSGKFAWYDSGYASGMLDGVFQTMGVTYERALVSSWKKELGLNKLGKPGSLALARELFVDQSESVLKRKKDHGRAESLLIGAWALGLRKDNARGEVTWPEIIPTETETDIETEDARSESDDDDDDDDELLT